MQEKEKRYKFVNETEDCRYFTMVPNYILNHSTADEQALYLQIKRYAGEKGECFTSQQTLGDKLGWSRWKVAPNIRKLIKRGWIEDLGKRDGTWANSYRVIDLWKINIDFYNKNKGEADTIVVRDNNTIVVRDNKPLLSGTTGRKTREEKPNVSVRANDRKDLKIIKLFAFFKGIDEKSKQFGPFLRRNLRPAGLLVGYDEFRLEKVMGWLRDTADFKWTLETVGKYIDEDLSALGEKKRAFNGEYKCSFGYWHPRGQVCGHSVLTEKARA